MKLYNSLLALLAISFVAALPQQPLEQSAPEFPGSLFVDLDSSEPKNITIDSPAVIHAPVFLYSRTGPIVDPCYPEQATNAAGDGPNPGTGVGSMGSASANPGADCTNPGEYQGDYTRGNPFPIYVSARYCGEKDEWWLGYDAYYVHDGSLLAGHRHDWEGITIIFRRARAGEDTWTRSGAVYNRHSFHDLFSWDDLESVSGEFDVKEIYTDRYHPKIYVGFFSHAAYRRKCDARSGCSATNGDSSLEWRSSDWYRIPQVEDIKHWATLPAEWRWDGTAAPSINHENMCTWKTAKPNSPTL